MLKTALVRNSSAAFLLVVLSACGDDGAGSTTAATTATTTATTTSSASSSVGGAGGTSTGGATSTSATTGGAGGMGAGGAGGTSTGGATSTSATTGGGAGGMGVGGNSTGGAGGAGGGSTSQPWRRFLVLGQSNASVLGDAALNHPQIWSYASAGWQPARVDNYGMYDLGIGAIGGGVARRALMDYGGNIRVINNSYPGQAIEYFLPASTTLSLRNGTANHFRETQDELVIPSGLDPEGLIWIQGENDASQPVSYYRPRLDDVILGHMAEQPSIVRVAIVGTSTNLGGMDGDGGVRDAQRAFCTDHSFAVFVDMSDVESDPSLYDGLHYTQVGYKLVANRIYDAAFAP